MKRVFWAATAIGLLLAAVGLIPWAAVLAPLLGLAIWSIGFSTFGSLWRGGSHIPEGPATPVDPARERITYWCTGCGTELLLLVRGAATPPRHCGERMQIRTELPR